MKKVFFVMATLLVCSSNYLNGQEVSISSAVNLRNYYAYEIVGEIEDRYLIYRDKGFVKEVDLYNTDMEHTQYAELNFEKKKTDVFTITGLDSVFQVLYGYFEKDSMVFKHRIYDKSITLVDSATLIKIPKRDIRKKIQASISEDKSKILLSTIGEGGQALFFVYDSRTRKLIWQDRQLIDKESNHYLKNAIISNNGEIFIVMNDKEHAKDWERLLLFYLSPLRNDFGKLYIGIGEIFKHDVFMEFDNVNDNLIITGSYSEKRGKDVKGYFVIKKDVKNMEREDQVSLITFPTMLFEDLLQGKKRKQRVLEDLAIQNVIMRQDGGMVIISEIEREFSRRNPYNNYNRSQFDSYSKRGWIDYYRDDIIVTSINPSMQVDWTEVLYKKQFSQDDDAIFSSFYILKTPSRLRFIYNDEIKKNNTVSEYLMDPAGRVARNSLLSTEYQNMKLRFKDAMQVSSNTILVPSEKNYDLNLVKITY